MAQILYLLVDKVNPNSPYDDAQCYKAGDVVSIREDSDTPYNKDPGIIERLGTLFGILIVPGKASDYGAFTVPEPGDPKVNRVLQRRAFKLNIGALQKTDVSHGIISADKQQDVLDVKVAKPALKDPNVLGEASDPNVLGSK